MTGHGEFPFEQYKHHPKNILRCGVKLYKVRAQFVARSYTSDNRSDKGSRELSMKYRVLNIGEIHGRTFHRCTRQKLHSPRRACLLFMDTKILSYAPLTFFTRTL